MMPSIYYMGNRRTKNRNCVRSAGGYCLTQLQDSISASSETGRPSAINAMSIATVRTCERRYAKWCVSAVRRWCFITYWRRCAIFCQDKSNWHNPISDEFINFGLSIWQKFENIDPITVRVVQEALCDILQSVFEEAFGSSAMTQNLYLLDVFVNIDTNEVAPDICKHYDSK